MILGLPPGFSAINQIPTLIQWRLFMFEAVINLFKEFDLRIVLLIVLATLVLLGSFIIKFKRGSFEFIFKWPGLRNKSE